MNEVFGKNPVTSRQFPVVFFDALGTLLHRTPDSKYLVADIVPELCEALLDRGYRLAIISNMSSALNEILRVNGVLQYFDSVITSEDVGASKPDASIFNAALEDIDVEAAKAIMVGDTYDVDVVGAQACGMKAVLFDPQSQQRSQENQAALAKKVIPMQALRDHRELEGVRIIHKLSELLEFLL